MNTFNVFVECVRQSADIVGGGGNNFKNIVHKNWFGKMCSLVSDLEQNSKALSEMQDSFKLLTKRTIFDNLNELDTQKNSSRHILLAPISSISTKWKCLQTYHCK
jgi:hypothetical protein